MKNDLKLKTAAEEIKEILRKYEITASVSMYAQDGYGEHFTHLLAPYSIAYQISDQEVRLYSKREDFNSDEEQYEKTKETAGMLNMLTDLNGINFMFTEKLYKKMKERFEITHTPK